MAEIKEMEVTKGFHVPEKAKYFGKKLVWFLLGAGTGFAVGVIVSSGKETIETPVDSDINDVPVDE